MTINAPKKKNTAEQDGPQLSIAAILQGALFVAGKDGMTLIELHKILPKSSTEEIRRHLLIMQDKYEKDSDMGLTLKEFGGRYKLLTKLQIKKEMQRFANLKFRNPLNSKLMEVLAIIAYNQPCTRPRISEIRGTDSAPLVDILMEKGLVVELGRADTWGRPFIYEVSEKFFDLFGINDIKELPEVQNFDVESFSDGSFFDTNRYEDN
ncbi:SMC-Scp complex subunit ScpB [[Mycoplasma] testudinis]|uniref:SMC-Scp complex subunit ScpB n=1 Tax=[Mycoplasma] testudinis TaxID=33924 RepID=UPI000696E61D|nr:SMC-Scp complex subunit ScpB [[Mycoplasma] testudinis]